MIPTERHKIQDDINDLHCRFMTDVLFWELLQDIDDDGDIQVFIVELLVNLELLFDLEDEMVEMFKIRLFLGRGDLLLIVGDRVIGDFVLRCWFNDLLNLLNTRCRLFVSLEVLSLSGLQQLASCATSHVYWN